MDKLILATRRVQQMRSELKFHGDTGKFEIAGTPGQQSIDGILETLNQYDVVNEPINREICERHGLEYDPQIAPPIPGEALFGTIIDKAKLARFDVVFPGYREGNRWIVQSGEPMTPGETIELLNQLNRNRL